MTTHAHAGLIAVCSALCAVAPLAAGYLQGQGRGGGQSITIRAARVLDGGGKVIANGVVEVRGTKIAAVDQRTGPVTYDLGDATVLPGMIDVHVHLNWTFGPDGKYGGRGVLPSFTSDAILDNARKTLMAGFTTVQSVGWTGDKPLKDAISAGIVNGPRILTSLTQIQGGTRTPDELRAAVRQAKTDGADLIKFFASASIREGGRMNVTQDQVNAVCSEAKALGLRTEGPTLIVTDLCTMRPHPETNEFEVTTLHPNVTEAQVREKTGWPVRFRGTVSETPPPTDGELATLRELLTRTARAHGTANAG